MDVRRPARTAHALETVGMSKRFGPLRALDDVSMRVKVGSFHALLGENGAGKSTLVKCVMGFQKADSGSVLLCGREVDVPSPRDAQRLGIGMVYQHFTSVPCLSVAENLVVARVDAPLLIDWKRERRRLDVFMDRMPFRVPLDAQVATLSAGERQKLEILKLLYLEQSVLILDEPTSVMTSAEADEVLGLLGDMAGRGEVTVLMISHKFREVKAFCDSFTVLRRGRTAGSGDAQAVSVAEMSEMMIGKTEERVRAPRRQGVAAAVPKLVLDGVTALDEGRRKLVDGVNLELFPGEIVGIAGVSGNGQSALVEILFGQRALSSGSLVVDGSPFKPCRADFDRFKVFGLPEEPMGNAAVPRMSVAENLAFRNFDKAPLAKRGGLMSLSRMRRQASEMIARYDIKTSSPDAPIEQLSGGNVQRTVLARELSGDVELLIVANPCFGLDFSSVSNIRAEIMVQRNRGAAVLLLSEDLDEILELADRVGVMSEGRLSDLTPIAQATREAIGQRMGGNG